MTPNGHTVWRPSRAPGLTRFATGPFAVLIPAVLGVVLIAVVDPNEPGHYPTCPFYSVTGLYCPGCGSMRAVHAMAHGRWTEALGLNPLAVAAAAWLVAVWAMWVTRSVTGRQRTGLAPPWVLWCLLAVVVAFGVLRNLAPFAFLAP